MMSSHMKYYKFFREFGYIIDPETGEKTEIPVNGGMIVDPKGNGVYYCDTTNAPYYAYGYGEYVAEVFPDDTKPIRTGHDDDAVWYCQDNLRIGPIMRRSHSILCEIIEDGGNISLCDFVFVENFIESAAKEKMKDTQYLKLLSLILFKIVEIPTDRQYKALRSVLNIMLATAK